MNDIIQQEIREQEIKVFGIHADVTSRTLIEIWRDLEWSKLNDLHKLKAKYDADVKRLAAANAGMLELSQLIADQQEDMTIRPVYLSVNYMDRRAMPATVCEVMDGYHQALTDTELEAGQLVQSRAAG